MEKLVVSLSLHHILRQDRSRAGATLGWHDTLLECRPVYRHPDLVGRAVHREGLTTFVILHSYQVDSYICIFLITKMFMLLLLRLGAEAIAVVN
jgi:hypothetical protein